MIFRTKSRPPTLFLSADTEGTDIATDLADSVKPIVESLGFRIVELHTAVVRGTTHVDLVVYRPEGVGIDDCAGIHRTILPRIEVLLGDRDVTVQVSSPGIDRTLKSDAEFSVFAGRGVRVLLTGATEWLAGVIGGAGEQAVEI